MSERVEIIEIGPREGIQNHPKYIDVANKVAFIESIFDAGFEKVEVTSFVHPKGMPQMRDACEVLGRLNRRKGKVAQVLVPNETGCRNAIACQAQEIVVWCYLTDELNYLTLNLDRSKTLKEINSIVQIAHHNGIEASAWIGGAFGYPGMEIPILYQEAKDTTQSLIQLGCSEVCLSDEFCTANPPLVKKLLRMCLDEVDETKIVVHFHDNRGLGLANIVAAYEEGIRKFKACIGGAGMHNDLAPSLGNAFNKNMFPSVATEDMVYVFEEMGIDSGIDIEKLIKCGRVAEQLLEKKLHSRVIANNLSTIN